MTDKQVECLLQTNSEVVGCITEGPLSALRDEPSDERLLLRPESHGMLRRRQAALRPSRRIRRQGPRGANERLLSLYAPDPCCTTMRLFSLKAAGVVIVMSRGNFDPNVHAFALGMGRLCLRRKSANQSFRRKL